MNHSAVCAEGDLPGIRAIAEKILSDRKIRIIKEPRPKMVMAKHIDPLEKNEFFLGEVLVTCCEVEIDDNIGYGCIIGTGEERSLYAAIIDAFTGSSMPGSDEISALLADEEKKLAAKRKKEFAGILRTKVNFETKKEG